MRVVRDIFSKQFERAIVDDPQQHHRLESFFTRTAPELLDRLELYKGEKSLFEKYGIDDAIQSTLRRRVDLPSGGYLLIEYTEAMTVIDINSGSFTGRGKGARLEDTITKTNLEAAEEVVRQLRLRDIGGIIVIDFIDMSRARNRDTVLKTLRKALDEDRTKTYVVEISPLGLVEMTRQNVTDGVREILTEDVPHLRWGRRGALGGNGGDRCRATARGACGRAPADRGLPDPDSPARGGAARRWARTAPTRDRGRHRQALPLRGIGGAADRPLRGVARGLADRGRGARAPVPGGRGGARDDRGAPHVRGGRRRGQARRLRDLGRRRAAALVGSKTLVRIQDVGSLRGVGGAGRGRRRRAPPTAPAPAANGGSVVAVDGSAEKRPRRRGRRGGRGRRKQEAKED